MDCELLYKNIYHCYILKIIPAFCYSYVTNYCLCIYYHFAVILLPIKPFIFSAFISFQNSIKNNSIYWDPNEIFG